MDELLNNAPCGFLGFTDDGKIKKVNQTLLDLLGYAPGELDDLHFEKILPAGGRIFYQTHFFPLLKLHDKVEEIYLSLRTKTGAEIPVLVNAVRRERAGGAFCSECIFVTMYRRNRFEEEILKAKKEAEAATLARDEFLSVISHELRTPLNAILGWTQILQQQMDEKTVQRGVEAISRSAQAQKMLVEDILDFERITTGKLTMRFTRVDLAEVIVHAVENISPAAAVKDIRLETDIESNGVCIVAADRDRLGQALWNLLSNAVKFTPKGGEIRVRCERAASGNRIIVADTGQGIRADFLPHVFDRFRQGDSSETKRHSGLGLGLAITHHIVELHGGTITAESRGENRGATFTVTLPLMD